MASDLLANTKLKPTLTVADFQRAGYQPTTPLAAETLVTAMRLDGDDGDEYWFGLENFYVITRYNHSHMYAMAVYQLSQALKGGH